jgi:3-hydroxyisobutyrate dehydrogenase/2-hydroxy-3-oxopropionate reductase
MARRFAAAGHDLVLWNRNISKAEILAGEIDAIVAATAANAAAAADVVITSLADDTAVRSVYLGESGVAAGIEPRSIAVETSTVSPETIEVVGAAIDATGAGFVECPVSGSVATVESGTLTVMAAGDQDQVARIEPVLSAIAKRVIHVGVRGNGAATKLAVNGLVHGLNVALSEALVLAEKAGVDRRTAYEVFASGAGGAPFVRYKRDAYEHPDNAPVAFSLDLVAKDLELITALGERVGAPMAQAETGLDIVRRAISAGLGDRDLSAVAVFLRKEDG